MDFIKNFSCIIRLKTKFLRHSPNLCRKVLILGGILSTWNQAQSQEEFDPAEVMVGERLFLETRFAEFFHRTSRGNINTSLTNGDPSLDVTITTKKSLKGSFAGGSMNCRACHMVDEHAKNPAAGMRTYADFAPRSPVPARQEDTLRTTLRNSPALVDTSLSRSAGKLFHFDGEFTNLQQLVIGTLTGRNYGYLPSEYRAATSNIAAVIRDDDGHGALAADFGAVSYKTVLSGKFDEIPQQFQLPRKYQLDVSKANDEQIINRVAELIAVYVRQLQFARNERGEFIGSPFDSFLEKNNLPRAPRLGAVNESAISYSRRLSALLQTLRDPIFVTTADGAFEFHKQQFQFGPEELKGLKIFLREKSFNKNTQGGVGACISCHPAPTFTDLKFHNTGISQQEYEDVHGNNSMRSVTFPSARDKIMQTTNTSFFARIPTSENTAFLDLGLWNVVLNERFPNVQRIIKRTLCGENRSGRHKCSKQRLLRTAFAAFKTPGLRDLSHSSPYFHNGKIQTLKKAIKFYAEAAQKNRQKEIVSGATELSAINLNEEDILPLVNFLRSLNEDYS
jgi:cytochrome c peroxidase